MAEEDLKTRIDKADEEDFKTRFRRTLVGFGQEEIPFLVDNTPTETGDQPQALKEEGVIRPGGVEYSLETRLGDGGMGEVWKAMTLFKAGQGKNDDVERPVALKFIRGLEKYLTEALIKEAKISAMLDHDNIVRFEGWHYLNDTKRYMIVMQYIEGMDINGLLRQHNLSGDVKQRYQQLLQGNVRRIPEEVVGFVMFQIASALDYAHNFRFDGSTGIIHRDVSPGNIMITEGSVKLGDFGVAVTTKDLERSGSGIIVGKLPYMAPEQIFDCRNVDCRSDLYSLGVVAYEMLTGISPNKVFRKNPDEKQEETLERTLTHMLTRPLKAPHEIVEGINPELSAIVYKLMSVWPGQRHNTAAELYKEVGECIYGKGWTEERQKATEELYEAVRKCICGEATWPNGRYETPEELHKALGESIFPKGLGITKPDLKRYIVLNEQLAQSHRLGLPAPEPEKMRWLNKTLPLQYAFTEESRKRLEKGENPARE